MAAFDEAPDLSAAEVRTLPLTQLVVDENLYSRTAINYQAIATYEELYEEDPARLPPLDVCQQTQPKRYLLADGFLRYYAAIRTKITALPCRIFVGTPRDAFLHGVAMNSRQQGQPYHYHDYQKLVRWFVTDAELSTLSHREITRSSTFWIAPKLIGTCNTEAQKVCTIRRPFPYVPANSPMSALNRGP